ISSIRWTTVNGGKINTGIDNIIQGSKIDSKSTPEPSLLIGIVSTFVIALLSRKKQATVK
ncbi:MAG: PEP-CTERM sorting domain-containing protein, partial [Trichodesmium sp. St19_bin2]|nr:PEP-CTERM sorting domain-containing protein [Trichodesmium sp. St19_bin2]